MNKTISSKPTPVKEIRKSAQKRGEVIRLPKTARKSKKLTNGTRPKGPMKIDE